MNDALYLRRTLGYSASEGQSVGLIEHECENCFFSLSSAPIYIYLRRKLQWTQFAVPEVILCNPIYNGAVSHRFTS